MKEPPVLASLTAPLAIVLGSGLGGVCDRFDVEATVSFADLPGVGPAAVPGHAGVISQAKVGGRQCLFVQGRRHRYEGSDTAVHALVAVLHDAGVRTLLLTSAAGCLDAAVGFGELMLVDDVIDLHLGDHSPAWRAARDRSPDGRGMPRRLALDPALRRRVDDAARRAGVRIARGILASLPGPVYETPAEITVLQRMGVSAVSMSVAPELAAASALGMRVAVVAHMTNWAAGLGPGGLSHEEVLETGRGVTGALARMIGQFIEG